jgi:hypothetical protein
MPRRLEPECIDVGREIEIVVDRLRHVNDLDAAGGHFLELHRRERRVVATDRDEHRHIETEQRRDRSLELRRLARRIGARDADVGTTAKVNPADVLDLERLHVIDVALHDPLEAVTDADDLDAFEAAADRRGADHAVDTRRRPAADENAHSFRHKAIVSAMRCQLSASGFRLPAAGCLPAAGQLLSASVSALG